MLEVLLARHGETAWNAENRIQGSRDIVLNASGQAQAHALGLALTAVHAHSPIHHLVCSDQLRARQTIAPFAQASGLPCDFSPGWRERCFGVLEGLDGEQVRREHAHLERAWRERQLGAWLPDGESLESVSQRVIGGLQALVHWASSTSDDSGTRRVLVVTHGGVLDMVYRFATGMPLDTPRNFSIGNCEIHCLRFDAARWQIHYWGERAHLAAV